MENRKYLNLDELLVWSDNPRHGPQEGENFSEEEAINILIDVVGVEKMYNLIADIFATKKLMGNVNPVVVLGDNKYFVYDGNRRVSALKILKNPTIVENDNLRSKIIKLIGDEDVSFADKVFVYITDEDEALEIMDKTHSGEQQGVGMISWEPYQRDISLNRREKALKYPYAFSVAQALGYNVKSFDKTPYTDLDRIFGSKILRDHFLISEESNEYVARAEYVVGMLVKYKAHKRFRSFSRQFNITDASMPDGPMLDFCKWVDSQEAKKKDFYFKTNSVDVFTDESFSFEKLNLQILNAEKKAIPFKMDELRIRYRTPNGIAVDSVDTSDTGDWETHIEFNGEVHSEKIVVKPLFTPKIDFVSKKLIGQGNTVDLRKLMIRATNGHGQNVVDVVRISSVGQVAAEIFQDIFTADNPVARYQIAYAFDDITGAPFSVTKEIEVVDKSNPLLAENKNAPLLSFNGTSTLINISEVVNKLVYEINNLEFETNICVIATSLRALLELSFDELHTKNKLIFSKKGDLKVCLEEFRAFLLGGELTRLCNQHSRDLPSYNNEKNCVEQIDSVFLSSYLNLAAHKSIRRIDVTKVAETARKSIAPILVYTSLILK